MEGWAGEVLLIVVSLLWDETQAFASKTNLLENSVPVFLWNQFRDIRVCLPQTRIQCGKVSTRFVRQFGQPSIRYLAMTRDSFRFQFLIAEALFRKLMSGHLLQQ